MPTEDTYPEITYDCDKEECQHRVIFTIEITEFSNDLEVYHKTFQKIEKFVGKCQVANEATIPNRPTYQEWSQCPFYQEMKRLYS